MVIIGILASIAIPQFNDVRTRALASTISHDIHEAETALGLAILNGDLDNTSGGVLATDAALRSKLTTEQLTMLYPPGLPDGLVFSYQDGPSNTGASVMIVVQDNTPNNAHADVLQRVREMRPTTVMSSGGGLLVAEQFIIGDLAPQSVAPQPPPP